MASAASEERKILQSQVNNNVRTINHPMALRKRLRPPRQPRPARRLPQVIITFTFLNSLKQLLNITNNILSLKTIKILKTENVFFRSELPKNIVILVWDI